MRPPTAGLAVAALLAGLFAACAAPKLTDMQGMSDELGLTEAQIRAVRPSVQRIAAAVDHYESDKEAFVETMGGQGRAGGRGPRGGDKDARRIERQEALRALNAKRVAYQTVIDRAVAAIATMLDEGQRERWADIEKPALTPPEPPNRDGRGGRGGRGGGLGDPGGISGGRGGGIGGR
jgi:hypothetical protein